jgi:hypothetical protein
MLFNNSNDVIYLGNSSVDVATGFLFYPHQDMTINIEAGVDLYGISSGTSSDVRTLEGV